MPVPNSQHKVPGVPASTPKPARRPPRRPLFIVTATGLSLFIGLVAVECVLRILATDAAAVESMTPGLVRYHPTLGWTLNPGWEGEHQHTDYRVTYRISNDSRRDSGAGATDASRRNRSSEADVSATTEDRPTRVAIFGDSFTFGLGVKDTETFASLLPWAVTNWAVPGYSTDQELLQFESVARRQELEHVVLVVCLVNDIFDNERLFPLQANRGKPRFRFRDDGTLRLENVPVPKATKPPERMKEDLARLVLGDSAGRLDDGSGWLGRTEIARRLGLRTPTGPAPAPSFRGRFEPGLELFEAILARWLGQIAEPESSGDRGSPSGDQTVSHPRSFASDMTLVLLPGRSYVEAPESASAQYQEYLADELTRRARDRGVALINLGPALRHAKGSGSGPLYFPLDGHLTPAGHVAVAMTLERMLFPNQANAASR